MFEPKIVRRALVDSFVKLDPRLQAKNPVMFIVEVGSVLTTFLFFRDIDRVGAATDWFSGLIAVFLWFTVLFANFAEAMAEGRGKAQADTLRKTRAETVAYVRQADGTCRGGRVEQAAGRRPLRRPARSADSRRRRRRRGHRVGRRVGDHRRVGAGDPRVGRGPLLGHRRHPGACPTRSSCTSRRSPARRSSTA